MSSSMFFLALVAIAYAAPAPGKTSYEAASQEITQLLQQGNDESACADLAKTLSDEVTNSVDEANKQLSALDDGSSCPSEGQDAVSAAQSNKENADKAASAAKNAQAAATDASVDFGEFSLASLESKECGQFWEVPAYKSAVTAKAAADEDAVKTEAAAKAAADALDEAEKAAATAVEECGCKVRASFNAAWKAASDNTVANEAAWTKAIHMKCVLAGTAAADCKVTNAPTPVKPKLADGVPADECQGKKEVEQLYMTGASQSSMYTSPANKGAQSAIDGNADQNWGGASCTHTNNGRWEWWKAKFVGGHKIVTKIEVFNRADCCSERLAGATVSVGEQDAMKEFGGKKLDSSTAVQTFLGNVKGDQIEINTDKRQHLTLCEVRAYGYN